MQRPYHKLIPLISLIDIMVGFVDTMVEVDESFGQATLYVNISFPPPDPLLQIMTMFTLVVNTMDGSAGMGYGPLHVFPRLLFVYFLCPGSRPSRTPILAGIHDYQQILNSRSALTSTSVLSIAFSDTNRLQNFSVVIFEDPVPEGVEDLNITLSLSSDDMNLEDRVIVSPAVATVRIRDNDRKFDFIVFSRFLRTTPKNS